MVNRSNNNGGIAALIVGILGLIILGIVVYKLKTRRPVKYMDAELIQQKGEIEHVRN